MARRKQPGQKEYNPLDDGRGRLPIDDELIRAVVADPATGPTRVEPVRDTIRSLNQAAVSAAPAGKGIALERLTAYNKFLTTPAEKLELDRLAAHISGALGVSVKSSQLIRACLGLLLRAENEIVRRAERQPLMRRPSNMEAVALAEFDQILGDLLSQAFRDAFPLRRP
jgi:hypothetical protein